MSGVEAAPEGEEVKRNKKGRIKKPTKIFSFRAKIPEEENEKIEDIMRKSNDYRNKLIELERTRRERVDQLLLELSPKLIEVEKELAEAVEVKEAAETDADQERITLQSKKLTKATKARISDAKKNCTRLRNIRKELRQELFAREDWKELSEQIEKEHAIAVKEARKNCGLHFGTYQLIEESRNSDRRGAPPEFVRYQRLRTAQIGVQITNGGGKLEDACEGSDGHIRHQLQIREETCPESGDKFQLARIRIGSDLENGRKPIWLNFRVCFHEREDGQVIPEDAIVQRARLQGRKIASHWVWKFQLTLSRKSWEPEERPDEAVAVMPGWTMVSEGVRAATWMGTDGSSGEVILNNKAINKNRRYKEIKSQADRNFDEIKVRLAKLVLKSAKAPEWIKEQLEELHRWRSNARLRGVIEFWRDNRWAGDKHAFSHAEAWRKQDKHLYEMFSNMRDYVGKARKTAYQQVVAKLARRYGTVILPDINWANLIQRTKVKEDEGEQYVSVSEKECRSLAGVSYLTEALTNKMNMVKVEAAGIAMYCGNCGAAREKGKCDCGIGDQESKMLNLLRRFLNDRELGQFFKRRNTMQSIRFLIQRQTIRDGEEEETEEDGVEAC